MLRTILPLLFSTVLANAFAAAELPEVKAGTHATECTLILAGVTRSCENYFYLATPDGLVKVFFLATPNGFAFIGSSEQPATEDHHVFPVQVVRREEGGGRKEYKATGECVVDMVGTGKHRSIAVECSANSEIGHATLTLKDDDTFVEVH